MVLDKKIMALIRKCGGDWTGYMVKFPWNAEGQTQLIRGLVKQGWSWLWCSDRHGKTGGWIGITPVAPVQVEE